MEEIESISRRAGALASEACVQLFEAYGVLLSPHDGPFELNDERVICGVVGFVSRRLRGSCLLAGNTVPLQASCPEGGRLRDWVGELANQLTGRLKTKFLARGVEVVLTTPIVLSGVRIEPLPRHNLKPTLLKNDDGDVMVWVEVEAVSGFDFETTSPQDVEYGEGDVLLF